jgi:hypothetical protein
VVRLFFPSFSMTTYDATQVMVYKWAQSVEGYARRQLLPDVGASNGARQHHYCFYPIAAFTQPFRPRRAATAPSFERNGIVCNTGYRMGPSVLTEYHRRFHALLKTYDQLSELILHTIRIDVRSRVAYYLGLAMRHVGVHPSHHFILTPVAG